MSHRSAWVALYAVLAGCGALSVTMPMTLTAASAPPCTAVVAVGDFQVESEAGLHIRDHGFHPVGALASGLEYMADASEVESERFRRRMAERFETAPRDALQANLRDLRLAQAPPEPLLVSGTLRYHEQHDVTFEAGTGIGSAGESERVTTVVDAHMRLTDAAGTVIGEATFDLTGPALPPPLTSPKYGAPLDVWRVVEQLVQRRVRFDVLLASAWSRDLRRGLHAVDDGDWSAAIRHWTRATASSSASTRRAAHFNLFVAHELAGQLDEARAQLAASEQELPAAVGFTLTRSGPDPEGQRTVTPNEFHTHRWRLEQRELIEQCKRARPSRAGKGARRTCARSRPLIRLRKVCSDASANGWPVL